MKHPSILIVEDEVLQQQQLVPRAESAGFERVESALTIRQAKDAWEKSAGFDAVILDLRLDTDDESDGYALLKWMREHSNTPKRVFVRSGFLKATHQFEAVALQTFTFYVKGEKEHEGRLNDDLKGCVTDYNLKHDKRLFYESASDKDVEAQIPFIASSDLSVLIIGPTGCGKSVLAQQIAVASGCAPIVPINCAAISPHLFESELFGHCRGSFTGAIADHLGKLMVASGFSGFTGKKVPFKDGQAWRSPSRKEGALILDEVATLSIENQAKLLTVLDGDPIMPVGHTGEGYLPNFRVFAVTNEEKKLKISTQFRPDLLERLQGFVICLAPAHDRLGTAGAVIDSATVYVRDEEGHKVLSQIKMSKPGRTELLNSLGLVRGGFRELNNVIARAHLYARMAKALEVSPEHIRTALKQSFHSDSIEKPVPPKSEAHTPARDKVLAELQSFFKLWDIEFVPQAKTPLDWAATLPTRKACEDFLILASAFTKDGKKWGSLVPFVQMLQPYGGTETATTIRNQFQASRENRRLASRKQLGL